MAAKAGFAMGLDFGTNSARALIVDVQNGREIATAQNGYPSGVQGVFSNRSDPNVARQHPRDYAAAMTRCVRVVLQKANAVQGFSVQRVLGIGVDATASTPLPVDASCRPLALTPAFANNKDAYAWLWKDHTAHAEADEITQLARAKQPKCLERCGGTYSSEWFWSKILHCRRVAPKVFAAADSWLELCDYIPALLVGCESTAHVKRSVCAAGHKAMFDPKNGLPSTGFLKSLHPDLAGLRRRLYSEAQPSDQIAGHLSEACAARVGLPAAIPVAVGAIDAHMGAVGAGVKPGRLVKILGTSSCDMLVIPRRATAPRISGLCGIVAGSIIPGYFGIEAGQPAVGDLFNWWTTRFDGSATAHERLTAAAARLRPGESGLLALDWNNGNRSLLADVRLSGLLVGQTLHTTPAEVYRALIEATAFGARAIIERLEAHGVPVREIVTCGGVAEKNPFLMQIYADVLGRPMKISRSGQTCALGAAICGAVVGGGHRKVEHAQKAMCGLKTTTYKPAAPARRTYQQLFEQYMLLHDAFGNARCAVAVSGVMKRLLDIRERARGKT